MKRNLFRRSLSVVLALLVTFGMTSTVFAGKQTKGEVILDTPGKIYVGGREQVLLDAEQTSEKNGPWITDIIVSDPSIAKIQDRDTYSCYLKGLKPGSVVLTVNYTYKGQKGSMSATVKVKPVPQCFKSIKVNGKKAKFDKDPFIIYKKTKNAKTVKIKAKLAPGWKVKSVRAAAVKSMNATKAYKVKVPKTPLKKGKKIRFAKKYKVMMVQIKLQNKTTGKKFNYYVQFYRNKPIIIN